ncbi:MAG: pilus assembly protein TadA [Halobacteriovoraceae bacterium]|nr:pilus assembly protein TadA [Halobacteriovoraceae bacterium]|tara:strand:- start:20123 stop:22234 length:2112 start_codon:yes stop_codon:yes gene_type:complete
MPGHIITVIGGKGGVGKSQIAANLAFAFASDNRSTSLLLDFDMKACGDQDIITGLKAKKTIKDIAEHNGIFDKRTLAPFLTKHKMGVDFIGMPKDPLVAEQINAEGLGKSLKAFTNLYKITIIDGGSELTDLTIKALEHSTMIMMVVTPDLLAINQTRRMYQELQTMLFPKDMVQVVLNQFEPKNSLINKGFIEKQLEKKILNQVYRDDNACRSSLTKEQPVFALSKTTPFSKTIIDTVSLIKRKNVLEILARQKKPDIKRPATEGGASSSSGGGKSSGSAWVDLKARIHKALVEEVDLKKQDSDDEHAKRILRKKTQETVVKLLGNEDTKGILNSHQDKNQIVKEILDEALALGPLEDLLANKNVTEIMVVGPNKIYYEEGGKNKKSDVVFTDNRKVLNVIEKIVSRVGRRIDEKTPYVDARLEDGSRVHAIINPCALDGGTITIRKFPEERLTYKDLIKFGSMTQNMADFLRIAVQNHRNIVISGGTGSGKTTLINVLGGFIPANERIITCEDSAELNFPQDHIVRLETKPPSIEGEGGVDIRCLVKQTLRMKPDRIVVGECRGGETLDMLQAMNTGHDGSMTTVHSNTPRDCLSRLETLVQYAGAGISTLTIKQMISSAVHMIVQQSRLEDGSRKVTHVSELGGLSGDVIILSDIFLFQQDGIEKGKIKGKHMATGDIPKFIEKIERKGTKIPRGLFKNA